jgi:hypothetical protein
MTTRTAWINKTIKNLPKITQTVYIGQTNMDIRKRFAK